MKKKYWGILLLCAALSATSPGTAAAGEKTIDHVSDDAGSDFASAEKAGRIQEDSNMAAADAAEKNGDFVKSPLPDPVFSTEAGFYEEDILLTLSVPKGFRICYTLDGSFPRPEAENAQFYEESLLLTDARSASKKIMAARVVRAVSVAEDGSFGDCVTNTYFIGSGATAAYKVPVVSLAADEASLFDPETGIFVHYDESGREWERPFYFEYFDGGERVSALQCGGRVHGGMSREIDMKSLRLYARAEYDTQKNFKYDFFSGGTVPALDADGQPIRKFKHLLLRGGGNEATSWDRTYFRDSLTAWLMKDTGLDIQAAQPVVVFLNGKYYGIMNLRERQDERYIEGHYGLSNELVAVYSFWYGEKGEIHIEADADTDELAARARAHYQEAFDFATTADLNIPKNYEKVCEYFDIDNYIDYLCVEIYCGNGDWPGNNCKAWSYFGEDTGAPGADGKIRWLLYDTEFGYGLYGHSVSENTLETAISPDSTEWPNPKGSTLLFRSLLQNDSFYDAFISRMLDLINENFRPEAAQKAVNAMAGRYIPLIQENRDAGNQFDRYDKNITAVNDYLRRRPKAMRELLSRRFVLGPLYDLSISFDAELGSLQVNSIAAASGANSVGRNGFSGVYACALPVTVTAIPAEGCRFAGFSGDLFSDIQMNPDGTATVIVTNPDEADSIALTALFAGMDDEGTDSGLDGSGQGNTGSSGHGNAGAAGSSDQNSPGTPGGSGHGNAGAAGSSDQNSPGTPGGSGQENTGAADSRKNPEDGPPDSPVASAGAEQILAAVMSLLAALLIALLLLQRRRSRHAETEKDKRDKSA